MIHLTFDYVQSLFHSCPARTASYTCLNADYTYLQMKFPHFSSFYKIKVTSDDNRKGCLVGVLGLLQVVGCDHAERMMQKAVDSLQDKTRVCVRNSRNHIKVTFYNI